MTSLATRPWNRWRYWSATIALCVLLLISGILSLRNASLADEISSSLHVPLYLGAYVLPILEVIAAVVILWRKLPTLRTFAYAWALYYFILEFILLLNVNDYVLGAFSAIKLVVWVLAFWWDRDRLAHSQ